jgi:tRNA(Arg) A34 adenosine deaminase TadA
MVAMTDNHESYMREAIALSASAMDKGNEPFGAVLVNRDGVVLLRVENTVTTGHDRTNHAEMNLVKEAMQQYEPTDLYDCTLYTSTEPCAMCAGALYWSGVGRVVYGCSSRRLGEIAGEGLEISCREIFERGARAVEVIGPVLEDEAAAVHLRYWPSE